MRCTSIILALTVIVGVSGCRSTPRAAWLPAVPVSPGSGVDLRGAGAITPRTWTIGSRFLPLRDDDEPEDDRRRWQAYGHVRLERSFIAGLDVTPLDEDVGAIVAYRWIEENELVPSITFATGADRIGTEEGKRSFSATVAKQFYEHLDLYGSIAYGQDGDRLLFPVGVGFRPIEEVSLTARHDGVHLHPGMTIHLFPVSIGALWIEKEDFAVTLTLGFGY